MIGDQPLVENSRLPASIDIRLLGKCNLECPFCFGPRHELKSPDFMRVVELMPRLHDFGVRMIVVTGGEPLLVKRLPLLLEVARSLGVKTVMSTNGTLVPRRHADVLPLLDWVALPLDGSTADVHDSSRPGKQESFASVLNSINLIRRKYPLLKIKLGTVVTRLNIADIPNIPALFESLGMSAPDIWKIYETSFSNYAADNRDTIEVSRAKFEGCVEFAIYRATELGWTTTVYRNSSRDGKYLFLEPNGDAMIIKENQEHIIGNFFRDFDEVVRIWSDHVDVHRLEANADDTYA
jgi:MoaA/NifB/PqqE/SkfB family radical SAM enzyme